MISHSASPCLSWGGARGEQAGSRDHSCRSCGEGFMELSLVSGVATDFFPKLIRNGMLLYCAFFERWILCTLK